MTSNVVSANPVLPGTAMNYTSSERVEVVPPMRESYLPEIAVIATAICFLMIVFFILFPKKSGTSL
jgi:hypothetical protein